MFYEFIGSPKLGVCMDIPREQQCAPAIQDEVTRRVKM